MSINLLFDIDGTLISEGIPFPGVLNAFNRLAAEPTVNIYLISNNTSRSVNSTYEKVSQLGFKISPENIITPEHVFLDYLSIHGIDNVRVLCNNELLNSMRRSAPSNVNLVSTTPKAVVVGFDTELTYQKLAELRYYFGDSAIQLWALHLDKFCPDGRYKLPDCGSIVALIETAFGIKYSLSFGKPSDLMSEYIKRKIKSLDNSYYIGDRLSTDMAFANKIGVTGIWVQTGDKSEEGLTQLIDIVTFKSSTEFMNKILSQL